jgi:hypothetical protein
MSPTGDPREVHGEAAELTAEQAQDLGASFLHHSHSGWRSASAMCNDEREAAEAALRAAGRGVAQAAEADVRLARTVTRAHGRYTAVLAVQRTVLALHARPLVDPTLDRRGWSPDAYLRLTAAWRRVIGPLPAPPEPRQPVLDLLDTAMGYLVRAAAGHDLARYDLLAVALDAADEVGGSAFRWTAAGWDRLPAGHTPAGGNRLFAVTDPGGDPLNATAADGLGSELPGWRR